jgi:hypothetical protein
MERVKFELCKGSEVAILPRAITRKDVAALIRAERKARNLKR